MKFPYSNFACRCGKETMEMKEETRLCPNCRKPVSGRIDKKFCSDECRTMFNNRIYRENNAELMRINRILRKNRLIMDRLYSEGTRKTTLHRLLRLGFDFDYMTSMRRDRGRKSVYIIGCYEYTYIIASDGSIVIGRTGPIPL